MKPLSHAYRQISLVAGILFLLFSLPYQAEAQDSAGKLPYQLSGYLSDMQSGMFSHWRDGWITDQLLQNRLNVSCSPGSSFTLVLEARNRLMFGESMDTDTAYAQRMGTDPGYMEFLTNNLATGESYVLNSSVDRFHVRFARKHTEVTLGRQRINSGQSFVWNPNDLFNVYSFFDFDYPERPGCDALRLEHYLSATSGLEAVASLDAAGKLTLASLFRANRFGYDIQLLASYFREEDAVFGLGWSGNLGKAGFNGEISHFIPFKRSAGEKNLVLLSAGTGYMFPNALYLQGEVLYSSESPDLQEGGLMEYYRGDLNVKKLALSEWNVFTQVSFPPTPLLNVSIAWMWLPGLKGWYAGPSITWGLTSDLDVSLVGQYFYLKDGVKDVMYTEDLKLGLAFLRLKWVF
ncbi:MAG TPA: hypothetical protein P5531_09965 [Bacteroidales bacterium]|nr:hypothetical protein [Bacteroidales bacterium]HSA43963.1 hypothetical protein [Bacteroidales bacterium]